MALIGLAVDGRVRVPHLPRPVGRGSRRRAARGRRARAAAVGDRPRATTTCGSWSAPVPSRCSPSRGRVPVLRRGPHQRSPSSPPASLGGLGGGGRRRSRRGGTPSRGCRWSGRCWCSGPGAGAARRQRRLTNLFSVADPVHRRLAGPVGPGAPRREPAAAPPRGGGRRAGRGADRAAHRPVSATRSLGSRRGCTGFLTAALYPLPLVVFVAVLGPVRRPRLRSRAPCSPCSCWPRSPRSPRTWRLGAAAGPGRSAAYVLPGVAGRLPVDGRPRARDAVRRGARWSRCVVLGLLALAVPRLELELAAGDHGARGGGDRGPRRGRPVRLGWPCTSPSRAPWSRSPRWCTATTGPLAWLGGLLLASATWVRLYDVGVQAPEAYTLPTAVALLLVGLDRLRRSTGAFDDHRSAGRAVAGHRADAAVGAGRPAVAPRAVISGLVCVALLVGGSALRWTAPGARRLGWSARRSCCASSRRTPQQTPQWVLIGAAGIVLDRVGHHLGGAAA